MKIRDRVAVVTGGASGIGEALCRRFAAEGARAVVVADLDGDGARRVASELGGPGAALGLGVDVGLESDVRGLVDTARASFDAVDLFCANAGVALGGGIDPLAAGPFAEDAAWEQSWRVHVMGHVYAARALLPEWLERGSGWWLGTASAAGLLTDFGSQAYSVTKHATVAFAEWLAIRYRDSGVGVSCLCPQGVRTPMVAGTGAAGIAAHLEPTLIEPAQVAEAVIEGLAEERFLILPHPEVAGYVARRGGDPERWLRGMGRVRAQLYDPAPGKD